MFLNEFEKTKEEKNILATKLFTPKLKVAFEGEMFKTLKNNMSNFDLSGSLTIFPSKKIVTSEIIFSNSKKGTNVEIITKIINNSFNN